MLLVCCVCTVLFIYFLCVDVTVNSLFDCLDISMWTFHGCWTLRKEQLETDIWKDGQCWDVCDFMFIETVLVCLFHCSFHVVPLGN